jgi:hypothetical protein
MGDGVEQPGLMKLKQFFVILFDQFLLYHFDLDDVSYASLAGTDLVCADTQEALSARSVI